MTVVIKRFLAVMLCAVFLVTGTPLTAYADVLWPEEISIAAESGIVIDANSKTILWGKNIHDPHYPASITKIMTALLTIENCELDEIVTFSHNAVYNVEAGSSNAGIEEGDQLSVKDCLYALLLKSANEAANALAEHIAGSTEAFAEMMNERAKELGCVDTHFANPSGLNDPEHYTSAYDMALISSAAFANPVFEEIDSSTYYKLPPNSINPDGLAIYPGHRMMRKSTGYYYPGIIGGKTGYTSLAGNTLVTCAERDGMKLIAVILQGSTPQYWTDTKNLLDFGFENFITQEVSSLDTQYSQAASDLTFDGLSLGKPDALVLNSRSVITIPADGSFSDVTSQISYELNGTEPENTVARIQYYYGDHEVGTSYLEINPQLTAPSSDSSHSSALLPSEEEHTEILSSEEPSSEAAETEATAAAVPEETETDRTVPTDRQTPQKETDSSRSSSSMPVWGYVIIGILVAAAMIGGGAAWMIHRKRKEEEESMARRKKRMERLLASGVSAEEYNSLLERRRSSYTAKKHKKRRGRDHLRFR